MQTKQQQQRESRYRRALRQCGFRSWKQANQRRYELIEKEIDETAAASELELLKRLQKLADLYVKWKTNDQMGRENRRLRRMLRQLETTKP
jgi:hypothetical protein